MKKFFLFFLCFMGILKADEKLTWIAYYGSHDKPEKFDSYDLIVFDSFSHPSLISLRERKKTLLGYISIGEAESYRPYFDFLKKEGLLLEENTTWPGSFYIDLRKSQWATLLVEEIIPYIIHKGFQGIFLDTVDSSIHYEKKNPKKNEGMKKAVISLIKTIRMHYPNILIMINRGYEIYDEVGQSINFALGESVYSTYNFKEKKYQLVPTPDYELQKKILLDAKKKYNLKIFTLDYWDPKETSEIKQIYEIERKNGFFPYVATIDLQKIVPEPQ